MSNSRGERPLVDGESLTVRMLNGGVVSDGAIWDDVIFWINGELRLPETNSILALKIGRDSQKEIYLNQALIFRGELLVSGRVSLRQEFRSLRKTSIR